MSLVLARLMRLTRLGVPFLSSISAADITVEFEDLLTSFLACDLRGCPSITEDRLFPGIGKPAPFFVVDCLLIEFVISPFEDFKRWSEFSRAA